MLLGTQATFAQREDARLPVSPEAAYNYRQTPADPLQISLKKATAVYKNVQLSNNSQSWYNHPFLAEIRIAKGAPVKEAPVLFSVLPLQIVLIR